MSERKVRMGIDVGGTHTKAVAIDNATHEIIGKSSVKTTHDDKAGVAAGVVQAFQNCLKENHIDPKDVIFVAHSTTQATNALIEGDVAHVGVVGVGPKGPGGWIAKVQTNMHDIDLGSGRYIRLHNRFICDEKLTDALVTDTIKSLVSDGAQVIVASESYGVDDMENENGICEIAKNMGLEATAASEITKLYGLTRRTRTAAINASILPKMLNTANSTEQSVKSAGVEVPLMIMRGDGGVMEISEMKKRPVLTMLSGPAASVMGSLMYLRASNGVYFEVGGTTTNIGVIKDGRPAIDYSIVGGHRTYISSLDVRVLGVAGGSMVRADKSGVKDVGPRSAHIAGMDYAVFTPEEGTYNEVQQIMITSETGGDIYYTTDGTDPTVETGTKYEEPVLIQTEGKVEIRAIAVNANGIPSTVASATYTIEFPIVNAPAVTPSTGQYTEPTQITITVPEGYTAYYTMDGSTPDPESSSTEKYTGPVDMPENTQTIFNAILVNDQNGKATEMTTRNYITTD